MQRAAWSRMSFSGSGSTNSCQCLMRSSTGCVVPIVPLEFEKTGDLTHAYSAACMAGGLLLRHLGERAAVFDRHHLPEHRAISLPVGEDFGGALGAGEAGVAGDQDVQPLGVVGGQVGHHVDAAVRLRDRWHGRIRFSAISSSSRHRLELDHRHVAAGLEACRPRRARRRCRPTCRRRNCARCGRARRRRRRSCIRSSGRRRLRSRRWRRNCARRSARRRRRGNSIRRRSRRTARCCRR